MAFFIFSFLNYQTVVREDDNLACSPESCPQLRYSDLDYHNIFTRKVKWFFEVKFYGYFAYSTTIENQRAPLALTPETLWSMPASIFSPKTFAVIPSVIPVVPVMLKGSDLLSPRKGNFPVAM